MYSHLCKKCTGQNPKTRPARSLEPPLCRQQTVTATTLMMHSTFGPFTLLIEVSYKTWSKTEWNGTNQDFKLPCMFIDHHSF